MTDFAADPLVRADSPAVIDRLRACRGGCATLRMLLN
jgi:cyclopropane-fatty-acyl-phospholipid synthase